MNTEKELRRIIKAMFNSLDAVTESNVNAVNEVDALTEVSADYKQGVRDAAGTIQESLITILNKTKEAMKPLQTDDECDCANCRSRRKLVSAVAKKTGTSKAEMDAAIMEAIREAKKHGKVAGAIKVNRTTGEITVLDDSELSDELRGTVDALTKGEDIDLDEYELDSSVDTSLNGGVSQNIKEFFSAGVKSSPKDVLNNIFTKMDKGGKC